ncbi:MAG: hypothetical protein U1F43_05950 [Myxococcota bacterium]
MSKAPDKHVDPEQAAAALRPHLSALVDGELEPLEAIAVQSHIRHAPGLAAEMREIERLKLAVHLAGTRDKAPEVLRTRLEAEVRATFSARRDAARLRRWAWPAGGMLAAAAAVALVVSTGGSKVDGAAEPSERVASVSTTHRPIERVDGKNDVLAKLIDFHRGDASAMSLHDLQTAGVLQTVERVPEGFIQPADGQRPKLVQVSTMGCNERDGGTTLAVLQASRVDLPQVIDNALESNGVYLDTIDGVEVRVSTSGDKLFVLLSGDGRSTSMDPI